MAFFSCFVTFVTSTIQPHNFKLFSTDVSLLCIEGRDKMEKSPQKKIKLQENKTVGVLATRRCTKFLIGWMKRFGPQ